MTETEIVDKIMSVLNGNRPIESKMGDTDMRTLYMLGAHNIPVSGEIYLEPRPKRIVLGGTTEVAVAHFRLEESIWRAYTTITIAR